MKKLNFFALAVVAAISCNAVAEGDDEGLIARNRVLDEMKYSSAKLKIQADMAKSYKDMSDSGFIVDPKGMPKGIGDMERLALEVRRRGSQQTGMAGANPNDPFGGEGGMFGAGSTSLLSPPPLSPASTNMQPFNTMLEQAERPSIEKEEVVTKPSEREITSGKKVLRLVELRGQSAMFFTNDGFKEVALGESIYEQKLTKVGVDNVTLSGKEDKRVLRIDWTKSVRYVDQ
jgi:hypothetical protein